MFDSDESLSFNEDFISQEYRCKLERTNSLCEFFPFSEDEDSFFESSGKDVSNQSTEESSLGKRTPLSVFSYEQDDTQDAKMFMHKVLNVGYFSSDDFKRVQPTTQNIIVQNLSKVMNAERMKAAFDKDVNQNLSEDDFRNVKDIFHESNKFKTPRVDRSLKRVCKMILTLIRFKYLDQMGELCKATNTYKSEWIDIKNKLLQHSDGRKLNENQKKILNKLLFKILFDRDSELISITKQRSKDGPILVEEAELAFKIKAGVTTKTVKTWYGNSKTPSNFFLEISRLLNSGYRDLINEFSNRNAELIGCLLPESKNRDRRQIFNCSSSLDESLEESSEKSTHSNNDAREKCPISVFQFKQEIQITKDYLKKHSPKFAN